MRQKIIFLLLIAFSSTFIFNGCLESASEEGAQITTNNLIDDLGNASKLSVKIPKVDKGSAGDKILVPIRIENLENLETVTLIVDYDASKVSPKTVFFESKDGKVSYLDVDSYSIETEVLESGKLEIKITKKSSGRGLSLGGTGNLAYVLFEAINNFDVSADNESVLSISECEVNDEAIDLDPEETVLDLSDSNENYGEVEIASIVNIVAYEEVKEEILVEDLVFSGPLSFVDTDKNENQIGGQIFWKPIAKEGKIDAYKVKLAAYKADDESLVKVFYE